jgi:phosphatidate cytidylyltransferase
MSPRERGLWLFGGIVVLLLLASVIGAVLRSRAQRTGGSATIDNLIERVNAWWVMVAVFGVTLLLGKPATLVLFGICSFFALREFVTLTPTRPGDYWPLVLCFYLVLPVQYVLLGYDAYGTFAIFIPVYAFLLLPAVAAIAGETDGFLERTAKVQWGLMVTVYCISYAPALLMLRIEGYAGASVLLLFYLVLIAQLSDVLQYVFGKLFGRTKLAPRVSPSKTVEGLVGGGLSTTLIGGALYWVTPFQWWQSLLLSLVIVVMGFLGGLALSAVKRSLGAKDWGVMIEGHGGMLDRLDSVCFAAPVFFHLVRYFYT